MALPVAAMLSVVVFSLELIHPWEVDNNVSKLNFKAIAVISALLVSVLC